MEALNNFLFKYNVHAVTEKYHRDKKFISYKNIHKILLLYQSDLTEQNDYIQDIAKELRKDKKSVFLYGYVEKKEITSPVLPHSWILGKENINYYKKPVLAIESIKNYTFDIVVDVSTSFCFPLQYLLLYANAACKIGMQHSPYQLLDFIIQFPETKVVNDDTTQSEEVELTPQILYEQIIFYLKSIRSND